MSQAAAKDILSLCLAAQSCPTLCDPMDSSLPGSSVHGIFQARTPEWVAISSPRDLPNPGMEPGSPALQADSLPAELCREAQRHLCTAQTRHVSSQPHTLVFALCVRCRRLAVFDHALPIGLAMPPSFAPHRSPFSLSFRLKGRSKSVFYPLFFAPRTPWLV